MSFDEKQHLNKDVIDLAALFRLFWFYKFSLLLLVISSIPFSVMYLTNLQPTYKAETVFERPEERTSEKRLLSKNVEGSSFSSFFSMDFGEAKRSGDSFYSEIRSESFLKTVIFENSHFDAQIIQKHCPLPSKEIPQFSLRSLLILFGILENKAPTEEQKKSLTLKCLNNMLKIDRDSYGNSESSAYRLSVTSGDPVFSANLANQIVEKYFKRHRNKVDQDFQNVKKYLSKVIADAQLELTEASKLMQRFIIKNTLLMNITPSSSMNSEFSSPFATELNKEVAYLSQLEKSLSQLKEAQRELSSFKELDLEKIKAFVPSIEVQEVLSRTFVASFSNIENLSVGFDVKKQEIKKIVNKELKSLGLQIKALEDRKDKGRDQTMQLMTLEDRFQELAIDVSKKQAIFEGLKDQLKEKIFETGLNSVKQPILLTRAVPPFGREKENKKLIMLIGALLFVFVGLVSILIRQVISKRVYSVSQLENQNSLLNFYQIEYKQLKLPSDEHANTAISQSFFSRAQGIGKCGCIIDISQKKLSNSLASKFSKIIASLLAANSSKIARLDTPISKNSFTASLGKYIVSQNSDRDFQGTQDRGISTFNDDEGLIGASEITKIKNKYSDYDKIICVLGAEISDLTKFKFIEQCDFYILIGRSFQFDEYTFTKFSNTVWNKEQKCLGFFLVN